MEKPNGPKAVAMPGDPATSVPGKKPYSTPQLASLSDLSKIDCYRMVLATAKAVQDAGHAITAGSDDQGTGIWMPGVLLNKDGELVVAN